MTLSVQRATLNNDTPISGYVFEPRERSQKTRALSRIRTDQELIPAPRSIPCFVYYTFLDPR